MFSSLKKLEVIFDNLQVDKDAVIFHGKTILAINDNNVHVSNYGYMNKTILIINIILLLTFNTFIVVDGNYVSVMRGDREVKTSRVERKENKKFIHLVIPLDSLN